MSISRSVSRSVSRSCSRSVAGGSFSPLQFSPVLLFDPSAEVLNTSDVQATDDDEVKQITDQSGNGNHATQGTATQYPLFKATAGGNGLPTIRFDGSNDWLGGTFATNLSGGGRLFMVVTKRGTGLASGRFFSVVKNGETENSGAGSARWLYRSGTSGAPSCQHQSSTILALTGGYASVGTRELYESHLNGTDNSAAIDGGTPVTASSPDTSGIDATHFGICGQAISGGGYLQFDMDYLALFPASMSDDDAATMTAWLQARFF